MINRIYFIEKNILPKVKITGNYTKKESDSIRSYVLLIHAEIEAYLEKICEEKSKKVLSDWILKRKKSHSLSSLCCYISPEINWEKDRNSDNMEHRLQRIVTHYLKSNIAMNHWIKKSNILSLLLPIWIEINQIDQTWLITMDSFGSTRGIIAHSSHRTQSQIDLITEKNRINYSIIPEIKVIDNLIKKIS